MDKEYFVNLLNYDLWAGKKLLAVMENNELESLEIIKLFLHLLDAQKLWHDRIRYALFKTDFQNVLPEYKDKDLTLSAIQTKLDENHLLLDKLIDEIAQPKLQRLIKYKDQQGTDFQNEPEEILTHLFSHGVHHRAQIAALMRQQAVNPPAIDFIYYSRRAKYV